VEAAAGFFRRLAPGDFLSVGLLGLNGFVGSLILLGAFVVIQAGCCRATG
jgi:hypothetical protein